ncbi:MAG TPA: FkbM family methyltransferase [Pyrinomonadaceae bacterium]|jgi:FkbM family methyltransferase
MMSKDASSSTVNTVRRLWRLRHKYEYFHNWLFSVYHRVLMRFPRLPLPGRQSILRVWLKGISEPFYVRLGTTDWYVLEEIFFDVVYDPLIKHAGVEVRQIIDLGANTGFSTRLWQSNFPEARIIAVEPDKANMQMCLRNLSGQREYSRPQLVQACVAGVARCVSMDLSGGSWRFSMIEADPTQEELIEARTLPQIMAECGMQGKIDLVKCNIEGAEEEVFAHCDEWIGQVRRLAVQVHYPYTSARLLDDLKRAGASLKLYHSMDCEAGSKLLFLEQNG